MFLAFRHEDLVDPDLPTFLTVWHARNWLPIGTFVPLRELGSADELVVMPTGGHSGEWAITDNTESKLMEWDGSPVRVITSNALAFGFLGLGTTEIRIPLEGRSTEGLYFFGGSTGGFGAAYLVHAVQHDHDRALSISAEPTGGPSGSINHRCG